MLFGQKAAYTLAFVFHHVSDRGERWNYDQSAGVFIHRDGAVEGNPGAEGPAHQDYVLAAETAVLSQILDNFASV